MPDPNDKAPYLQRTYLLTVPVHDLMGDAPATPSPVSIRLFREDDHSTAPLFGPRGLVTVSLSQFEFPSLPRDPSMISAGTHQFRLIPNEYYFVPTKYVATVGGRSYTFSMPAADANLIRLLDADPATGGGGGGMTAQLPDGTDARNELRWIGGRWAAVNTGTVRWSAITPVATYASLAALMLDAAVVAAPGGTGPNAAGDGALVSSLRQISISTTGAGNFGSPTVETDEVWPVAGPAPTVWAITSTFSGWIDRYTLVGRLDEEGSGVLTTFNGLDLIRPAWGIIVNGISYDVSYLSLDGVVARPDPAASQRAYISFRYTSPPTGPRTVTQLN